MSYERESKPQGALRFITGTGTLDRVFNNLPAFSQKFPEVIIHFNSLVNVLQCQQFQTGDIDVGVIPVTFTDPSLIQHHLFDMLLGVYASPKYLHLYSRPKTLNDLDLKGHRLIAYSGDNQKTFNKNIINSETQNFYASPSFTVDSGLSMRNALINGLGIGPYGYERDLVENNLLVDVFPDIPDQKIPYYFTYHRRLEGSPKIKAFHEFMKEIVKVWQRPDGK